MPTAHAHIRTDRASRYLTQLCKHGDQISHGSPHRSRDHGDAGPPPAVRRAEWSETEGVIDFGWGRCTLHATDDALTLRAEADDPQLLRRVQDSVTARLEGIGRRDDLAVAWSPAAEPEPEPAVEPKDAAQIVAALMTPAGRADPFPLYAAAHRIGPVTAFADGWFLVSGYAAVNQVLRDPGFGLPDPAESRTDGGELGSLGRSILRANPPDHGRMRSLISQVFTPRRIGSLRPAIEGAVDTLLDDLAERAAGGAAIDFMDRFAFPLPVTVICELLGVPRADRERFRPLAADLTEVLELAADPSEAARAAARELSGYFARLVADRRAAPRDDLIGALVAARDADDARLSEEELLANLVMLLVAGFETTTNLLGNGLKLLFEHPRAAARLRSAQPDVAGFVEEVLRFDSPVQAVTRTARADGLSVAGTPVARGSQLILLIGAANRDPGRYPDPGRFDPARTDIKPLSFGAGAHVCIGNGLARLEAAVAFPRLLARFPALAPAADARPTRRDRLVLRGYQTLPVVAVPK